MTKEGIPEEQMKQWAKQRDAEGSANGEREKHEHETVSCHRKTLAMTGAQKT